MVNNDTKHDITLMRRRVLPPSATMCVFKCVYVQHRKVGRGGGWDWRLAEAGSEKRRWGKFTPSLQETTSSAHDKFNSVAERRLVVWEQLNMWIPADVPFRFLIRVFVC